MVEKCLYNSHNYGLDLMKKDLHTHRKVITLPIFPAAVAALQLSPHAAPGGSQSLEGEFLSAVGVGRHGSCTSVHRDVNM